MVKLNEPNVERIVRKYLIKNGWDVEGGIRVKKKGEHGADIEAKKPRRGYPRSYQHLVIEVRGEIENVANRYYGLYTLFGQIISRMKKVEPRRYRVSPYFWMYGIALPKEQYFSVLRKRAKEMEAIWRWMRLKIYLVRKDGNVEERNWKDFLK